MPALTRPACAPLPHETGMSTSLNGAKMFVTNGERGHVFAILAKTNPMAQPQQRGISAFIVEKGLPDFRVERKIKKLGYRGLDTCELIFEDCRVPKDRLIGRQGEGFKYVLTCPGDWPYQCCSAWRRHGAGGVRG